MKQSVLYEDLIKNDAFNNDKLEANDIYDVIDDASLIPLTFISTDNIQSRMNKVAPFGKDTLYLSYNNYLPVYCTNNGVTINKSDIQVFNYRFWGTNIGEPRQLDFDFKYEDNILYLKLIHNPNQESRGFPFEDESVSPACAVFAHFWYVE